MRSRFCILMLLAMSAFHGCADDRDWGGAWVEALDIKCFARPRYLKDVQSIRPLHYRLEVIPI